MYKLSKYYNLLYELIQKSNVVCYVNYNFRRNNVDFHRDICQCKKKSQNDIVFVSRGHEYGSVNYWDVDEQNTVFDLFLSECKSLDVEFIPF